MIDLLLFSKHKRSIKYFNKSSKFSQMLVAKRKKYWKKTFGQIFEEFISEFKPEGIWLEKLEEVLFLRNGIGHSKPSISKEHIFIQPSAKKLTKYLEVNSVGRKYNRKNEQTYKINFYDEQNYNQYYKYIIELDEKYFPYISNQMGLDYFRIR